jgi:hypothetical protein
MLRAVGRAVVVNPDAPLRRIALEEGWEIVELDRLARRLKMLVALGIGTALASAGRALIERSGVPRTGARLGRRSASAQQRAGVRGATRALAARRRGTAPSGRSRR